MTLRFYLLLALITVASAAWLALHYQFEHSQIQLLEDITSFPVYAYVSDTSKVSPLLSELSRFPELDSLQLETGTQAGRELVHSYNLPVSDDLLATYSFPDLITIRFLPVPAALAARSSVISTLWQYLPEEDVDAQSMAWTKNELRYRQIGRRKLYVDIYAGIMLLLCFVFGRLVFEQSLLLLHKRKQVSVVDYLRHKAQTRNHSLMLFLLPLLLGFGTYYILAWQNLLSLILPYWFMGAVAGTLLIGSLIVMIILHLMDHDNRLHEGEFQVVTHQPEPEGESSLEP